ncbi:MAG TPA: hypothetical protein VGO14_11430 [Solirubrobacteraceae bacterium]|nr:hypothetical protein [Solirubrobacteraceae bacterium]
MRPQASARTSSCLSLRPEGPADTSAATLFSVMSPTWIWMQIAVVVFVLIGMIVAVTKLA